MESGSIVLPRYVRILRTRLEVLTRTFQAEIDSILELGVDPSRIIYANPCKTKNFIRHAARVGVDLMTFDNEPELYKIAELHPKGRVVLRIKVDDSHSVCKFSAKFGAGVEQAAHLLSIAKKLSLDVVGVSFHVGSGCESADSHRLAIESARLVFDIASTLGFKMSLLDLGGGWPGTSDAKVPFLDITKVVNTALDVYFPEDDFVGLDVIAEPGRYYVASAFTLATMIIAKREVELDGGSRGVELDDGSRGVELDGGNRGVMYYLNDGVYGSFNCTIFDHWVVEPTPFVETEGRERLLTTLWGPTCDSMDLIKKDVCLPEMEVGEWIIFKEMGAYTLAAASTFNGFQIPCMKYFLPLHTRDSLKLHPAWPRLATIFQLHDSGNVSEDEGGLFDVEPQLIAVH